MSEICSEIKLLGLMKADNCSAPVGFFCTKNFSWAELLVNQTEIPSIDVLKNLRLVAQTLEKYRMTVFKNSPVKVTSGWRSQAYNKKIGGATNSYHCKGMAIDFVVAGMSPQEVQKILDPIHNGGLEFAPTWTHVDLGPKRRFKA